MKSAILPLCLLFLASFGKLIAGCSIAVGDQQRFDEATAVAEVQVISKNQLRLDSGEIATRYTLGVSRNFKGDLPATLSIDTHGGELDGEGSIASDAIDLTPGEAYVLHFSKDRKAGWTAHADTVHLPADANDAAAIERFYAGGASDPGYIRPAEPSVKSGRVTRDVIPGSRVTPTGYTETGAIPIRHILFDTGLEMPYYIDVDPSKLPAGISQADAITAVSNAFTAWSGASSTRFRYAGLMTASANASAAAPPGAILVQLHDTYGYITDSALGVGGGAFTTLGSGNGAWAGGQVAGQPFQKFTRGYVIMNHRTTYFDSSTVRYAEVLTHEIGHSLGLQHSSNDPAEPDPILHGATMYYAANNDGRGAAIAAYDVDRIRLGYPVTNTAPFSMDRELRIVTGTPMPSGVGIDRVSLLGADLQTSDSLTLEVLPATKTGSAGSFSVSGNTVIFTAAGRYLDNIPSTALIASGTTFDTITFQYRDGVNISPAYKVKVVALEYDTQSADGLSDSWLLANFGDSSPGPVGSARHPDSDPDKDGITNRMEHFYNTDPNDPNSGPVVTRYDPVTRAFNLTPNLYMPLAVETSTDLVNWSLFRLYHTINPAALASVPIKDGAALPKRFYRVKVTP